MLLQRLLIFSCGIFHVMGFGTFSIDTDYYELLGVNLDASDIEIRQAFKKLAVQFHPDKNPDAPREHFVKISEAYDVLKNPIKRREYNYMKTSRTRSYNAYGMSNAEYQNYLNNGLYSQDENIESLSSSTYYSFINSGYAFVNFYSPFCPPCQNLAKTYRELAEKMNGVIKLGAVNCKYYSNFCSNTMGIGRYPTLIFYKEGQRSYFIYRGEHSLEELESFLMQFIQFDVPTVNHILSNRKPVAYILGDLLLKKNIITRLAWKLRNSVSFVRVMDQSIRETLSRDDSTTLVLAINGNYIQIAEYTDDQILDKILDAFPDVDDANVQDIARIRNNLRSNNPDKPCMIHFYTKSSKSDLLLKRLAMTESNIQFVKINCDTNFELCRSFQIYSYPGWGLLKHGGTYEVAHSADTFEDLIQFIQLSSKANNYQTLSLSEMRRIANGNDGQWALLIVSDKAHWQHIALPFKRASIQLTQRQIQFGVSLCVSGQQCYEPSSHEPYIIIQNYTNRFIYRDRYDDKVIVQFIQNILYDKVIYLDENSYREKIELKQSNEAWLLFNTALRCGAECDILTSEIRIVAKMLENIDFVHVGILNCDSNIEFCARMKIGRTSLRLYPRINHHSYVGNLNELNKALYISSWVLDNMDNTVTELTQQSFRIEVSTGSSKSWLIYFHSPRCSHCYEYHPNFVRVGLKFKDKLDLGRVNCISERILCQQNHIRQYPSIVLFLKHSNGVQSYSINALEFKNIVKQLEDYIGQSKSIDNVVHNEL